MKIACFWLKKESGGPMEFNQEAGINPHYYKHLIFDKEAKIIQCKKENFLTNCLGITDCQDLE